MNEASVSRADAPSSGATGRKILVWDVPVRVFHWLAVLCFAGAYLTAESERWRPVHTMLGYTMGGLVGFRLLWGLVGSRHARFSSFVRGPGAVMRHVRAILRGQPERHVGHNPVGALAIVAMLGLALAVTASGWATYQEVGGKWLEELHEVAANTMLGVVAIHVAGVALGSWLERENLVGAMITGRKSGRHEEGLHGAWRTVGALILAAVLGFWWLQWQGAPAPAPHPGAVAMATSSSAPAVPADRDDD